MLRSLRWFSNLGRLSPNSDYKFAYQLIESLRVTLKEALEFNRQEAKRAAAPDYIERPLTV